MSPDPYAPKGWPRTTREVRTELETFTMRLQQLGGTPDEVAQVVAGWDELDPDGTPDGWTRARRDQVLAMHDDELRRLLVEGRDEYAYATTTEEEARAQAMAAGLARARQEAAQVIYGNVASVLDWVGADPIRALVVLELEQGRSGANRKTLVEPLTDLVQ